MPLLFFSAAQNASARAQAACLMHSILALRPWRRPETGWRTAALFYRRRAAPHVCATAERLTLILAGLAERFQRAARLKDRKKKKKSEPQHFNLYCICGVFSVKNELQRWELQLVKVIRSGVHKSLARKSLCFSRFPQIPKDSFFFLCQPPPQTPTTPPPPAVSQPMFPAFTV